MNHQDAQTPQIGRYEDSIVISIMQFCVSVIDLASMLVSYYADAVECSSSFLENYVVWYCKSIQANRCSERDFSLFFTTHSRCIWKNNNIIEYVFINKRVKWLFSRCLDVWLLMIFHLKPILKSFDEYIYSSLYQSQGVTCHIHSWNNSIC